MMMAGLMTTIAVLMRHGGDEQLHKRDNQEKDFRVIRIQDLRSHINVYIRRQCLFAISVLVVAVDNRCTITQHGPWGRDLGPPPSIESIARIARIARIDRSNRSNRSNRGAPPSGAEVNSYRKQYRIR